MEEENRKQLQIVSLLEGFLRSLEEIVNEDIKVRDLIRDWDRVIQWRVEEHGKPLLMIVKDQKVYIQHGLDKDPDLSITLNAADTVLRWLSGNESLWDKAIEERSIKARGDWWDLARLEEVVRLSLDHFARKMLICLQGRRLKNDRVIRP